jgi:sortase (surface protein transpeptidase)
LIAKIGVDAWVEPVGVDRLGNMAVPSSPQNVGWYRFGPRPGGAGDAVLAGHLDWTSGPAVFWELHRLAPRDEVVFAPANGTQLRFRVTSVRAYSASSRPPAGLFASSGPPRLSLITCAGAWDAQHGIYAERLVVDAVLD